MAQNIDVFDFELTDDQMTAVGTLDTGTTLFFDHRDPEMQDRALYARDAEARPLAGADPVR